MNIAEIENLTEQKAKEMALEEIEIKGHNCYLVDLGKNFGYSILVFKNGMHIYYANDYELHHGYIVKEKGRDVLRQYYIKKMNKILFTNKELLEDIKTYDEYKLHYFAIFFIEQTFIP